MRELHKLSRDLVGIPSHESEARAGDYIETWLRDHTDANVIRDEAGTAAGRGGNVVARKGDGPVSLALVGHHDVVPPDAEQLVDGEYRIEEQDSRLYGRGTADMKGSVAAAMCAFRDAAPAVELIFASFVGEEVDGIGVRAAIENGFTPTYAIVAEGTTNYSKPGVTDVAVAHRGRREIAIVSRGSAAHAGQPGAGQNAIYRAHDALDIVRNLDPAVATLDGHTLEGSVVATRTSGGAATNVVPERCTITLDERTVPGERTSLERLEALDGVSWHIDSEVPPMKCTDDAFATAVLEAARAEQEGPPEHVGKPHATDASYLASAGTHCLICGASEPGEAHTASESVSLDVLDRCYRIYRRIAETPTAAGF